MSDRRSDPAWLADAEFEAREGHLFVRLLACDSADRACAVAERILEDCARLGLFKVLIDAVAITQTMPLLSYYEAGTRCAELKDRYVKVACIVHPQATNPDRFYENVLRNRGIDYRWFLEDDQARQWLLEK